MTTRKIKNTSDTEHTPERLLTLAFTGTETGYQGIRVMWTSQLFNFSLSSQRQRLTLQTAVQLSLLLTPKCHGLLAGSLASRHTTLHYSNSSLLFQKYLLKNLSPT